jgi:hypothetical protein
MDGAKAVTDYLLCVVVVQLAFGFHFIVAAIKKPKQSQSPHPWEEALRALMVGGGAVLGLEGRWLVSLTNQLLML